jgi:hypothetical protein
MPCISIAIALSRSATIDASLTDLVVIVFSSAR